MFFLWPEAFSAMRMSHEPRPSIVLSSLELKMMLMYDDVKVINKLQSHNVMGKACYASRFTLL